LKQSLLRTPATLALTTRVDARTLAALESFWISQDESPRSISELVRISLEMFNSILQIQHLSPEVKTQEEALHILEEHNLSTRGTQPRVLAEAILQESGRSLAHTLITKISASKEASLTPPPPTQDSVPEAQVDLALDTLKNMLRGEE